MAIFKSGTTRAYASLTCPGWILAGKGLGKSFTDANLHVTVVLIDENDCKYDTKFLAAKTGLSGGWRAFAVAHKLNEGDVLIFQLIKPCIFKVYIVRENDLTQNVSLMQLYSEAKPIAIEFRKSSRSYATTSRMRMRIVVLFTFWLSKIKPRKSTKPISKIFTTKMTTRDTPYFFLFVAAVVIVLFVFPLVGRAIRIFFRLPVPSVYYDI